ncbi:MAG: hypothetical protein LBQ43_00810 [Holosporales bacterium]|nr:hypothetical protein [Holosporales bacterium]
MKLKSDRKRVAKKLKALKVWLNKNKTTYVEEIVKKLNVSLRGYYNYYYVVNNTRMVTTFVYRVEQMLFRMLNRRSQKKSYTLADYRKAKAWFLLVRPNNPKQI